MISEELKVMFPDYHPEEYIFSVGKCCGSCKKGSPQIYYIECQLDSLKIKMFPYGLCPQYEQNKEIIYPMIIHPINDIYGNGEG